MASRPTPPSCVRSGTLWVTADWQSWCQHGVLATQPGNIKFAWSHRRAGRRGGRAPATPRRRTCSENSRSARVGHRSVISVRSHTIATQSGWESDGIARPRGPGDPPWLPWVCSPASCSTKNARSRPAPLTRQTVPLSHCSEKGVRLLRVDCPKDVDWPVHSYGNTAING